MNADAGKNSDLKVRTLSGIAMLVVAIGALWLGGTIFSIFVGLIALGMMWEWWRLSSRITQSPLLRGVLMIAGLIYLGLACAMLLVLRDYGGYFFGTLMLLSTVWATDIGAYFVGRSIGGPKIAPAISPSKTWAGLIGGMSTAALVVALMLGGFHWHNEGRIILKSGDIPFVLLAPALAVIAQAGDFLESWMKRKAGVKDSSNLIPGHGGLLDRLDGVIAVLFVLALAGWFGLL